VKLIRRAWGAVRKLLRLKVVLIVLAVFAAVALYFGVTFVQVYAASLHDQHPKADAIVVLGAAQYDGRPSPVLTARLQHGLDLYKAGVAPLLVVTGGRQPGDRFTEATSGYNWLRDRGVPDSAIRKEVQGRNTYESIAAVSRFLKADGMRNVVLVSNDYHAARLKAIAGDVGLEAHVSPAGRDLYSGWGEFQGLAKESVKLGIGRIIGYRRLSNLTDSN
jgi:uncharacterized SAM-binding protein YcdF (DUF218 family)